MTHDEYKHLVDKLNELSAKYHLENVSDIPDTEYDKLYKQLVDYEQKNPSVISEDSPTQRVGEVSKDNQIRHVYRMYSLENAFDSSDLMRFMKRFDDMDDASSFYVDCKMDGLSVELIYNNGSLIRGTTRGDGKYGEDVTANLLTVGNIPKYITVKRFLVVRGEIVVFKKTLKLINEQRSLKGLSLFSNCRNCASGSLRQKDPKITEERDLKFYAWDLKVAGSKLTHQENMMCLDKLGFAIPKGYLCTSLDEIEHRIADINMYRNSLPYDIDGVVIKQNNTKLYDKVGCNRHAPLYSIAYKFKATSSETSITEISWQMGRTGKLTPVAAIEPVNLNGATISKVTLNNASFVENNKIGIGTVVSIIRSADVIPKIDSIIESKGDSSLPDKCPFCGEPLRRVSTDLKCENHNCSAKLIALLTYIVGKDVLNIKGISDKFVTKAVQSRTITKLTDIFNYVESKSEEVDQHQLDRLVMAARDMELIQILPILCIPGFNKIMASKMLLDVSKFKEVRPVFTNEIALRRLGFPPSLISKITEWCKDERNIELLKELEKVNFSKC